MKKLMILLSTLLLTACLGMPKQVQPVNTFQLERYLGTWYEIARLDHAYYVLDAFVLLHLLLFASLVAAARR